MISIRFLFLISLLSLTSTNHAGASIDEKDLRPHQFAKDNQQYWDKFYKAGQLPRAASSFADYIIKEGLLDKDAYVLDIACGNGRDTFAFRKAGFQAYGLDVSPEATRSNLNYARESGIDEEIFRTVDVCNPVSMSAYQNCDAVYARFFIHAITAAQEAGFLEYLSQVGPGTRLFLEFRTDKDPLFQRSVKTGDNTGKTDHNRRYINFEDFCKKIYELGYRIDYKRTVEKNGLSVAKKTDAQGREFVDDPVLGRIIATKK